MAGMHINPKHEGLFHKDVGKSKDSPITAADVMKGLSSGSAAVRKRANFARMMTALDFAQNLGGQEPPFFSGNLASLSSALRPVAGVQIVEQNTTDRVEQTVTYRLAP